MTQDTTQFDITEQLDRNNEDKENQEAADESIKIRCTTCFKEIFPTRRCGGHGSGSGSAGGGSSSGEKTEENNQKALEPFKPSLDSASDSINPDFSPQQQADEALFDEEIISELLLTKLLIIDNDSERGILTIKLQCLPQALSDEQRNELKKFVAAIESELHAFLKEKNISEPCKTVEKDKNGNPLLLRISLPTPALYDTFIQRLANKHLLPVTNIEQKNLFHPSPLSIKPTAYEKKNEKIGPQEPTDEQSQEAAFRPSPFSSHLKPII